MKKTEKILGLIFFLALILRLLNVPGNSFLATISALLLAYVYCFLSFVLFNDIPLKRIFKKESYKGLTAWRIIGTIWFGFALSALVVGILFKLLHLPEAEINIIFGLIASAIVFLIAGIRFFQTKKDFYKRIVLRFLLVGGLGLLILNTNEMTVIKIQYRNYPGYIEAYENYLKDPDNKELWFKLETERYKYVYGEKDYEYLLKVDYPEYYNK